MGSQGEQMVLPQLLETTISVKSNKLNFAWHTAKSRETFEYGESSFFSLVGRKRFTNMTSDKIAFKV